jgi:hypothetical protein
MSIITLVIPCSIWEYRLWMVMGKIPEDTRVFTPDVVKDECGSECSTFIHVPAENILASLRPHPSVKTKSAKASLGQVGQAILDDEIPFAQKGSIVLASADGAMADAESGREASLSGGALGAVLSLAALELAGKKALSPEARAEVAVILSIMGSGENKIGVNLGRLNICMDTTGVTELKRLNKALDIREF